MGERCLAQEHDTMSLARARTRTARFGDERSKHEATASHQLRGFFNYKRWLKKKSDALLYSAARFIEKVFRAIW